MRLGFYLLYYGVGKFLFSIVFRLVFHTRIVGRERVPRDGGLLVVCNHISFVDPPLLGVAMPRPVEFMTMVELFRKPWLARLLRTVGCFPIDRSRIDHGAAREAIHGFARATVWSSSRKAGFVSPNSPCSVATLFSNQAQGRSRCLARRRFYR